MGPRRRCSFLVSKTCGAEHTAGRSGDRLPGWLGHAWEPVESVILV